METVRLPPAVCPECKETGAHRQECFVGFQRGLVRARPGLARVLDVIAADRIEEIFTGTPDPSARGRRAIEFVDELLAAETASIAAEMIRARQLDD